MSDQVVDKMVLCNLDQMLQPDTGKLLTSDETVLRLFRSEGGRVTFITGKSVQELSECIDLPAMCEAVIACNGVVLYDVAQENELQSAYVDEKEALVLIQDIMLRFPTIGVEVVGQGNQAFVVRNNQYIHHTMQASKRRYQVRPLEELSARWLQVRLWGDPVQMEQMKEHTRRKYYGSQNCIQNQSENSCVILSQAGRLENALRRLSDEKEIALENIVVLSDSPRDGELMQLTGRGVCSGNTRSSVRQYARKTTLCGLDDGGVGEYLYAMLDPLF